MNEIKEHIRLLSIGYFVVAGLTALFSLFPLIHIAVGVAALSGAFPVTPDEPDFPNELFGWIFIAAGSIVMIAGFTVTALIGIAGKKLKNYQSRTYCLVVSGILCAIFPHGTVLGVLTIVVLTKPEAKSLFPS